MPGPRSYPTAAEKALFQLSRGTCYHPECRRTVVVFIDPDTPVVDVQICHIRGAFEGSPRYDPNMTDRERAAFPNLLLLCKPHHELVDRIRPDDFPVETLIKWKRDREGDAAGQLAELDLASEGALSELIEAVVARTGPRRDVAVKIAGGTLEGGRVLTMPIEGWKQIVDNNPHFASDAVVATTVRNVGHLPVFVEAVEIRYELEGEGKQPHLQLLGRNDFQILNPNLPQELPVGASMTWITALDTIRWVVQRAAETAYAVTSFEAEVRLGTGEQITSPKVAVSLLPL